MNGLDHCAACPSALQRRGRRISQQASAHRLGGADQGQAFDQLKWNPIDTVTAGPVSPGNLTNAKAVQTF